MATKAKAKAGEFEAWAVRLPGGKIKRKPYGHFWISRGVAQSYGDKIGGKAVRVRVTVQPIEGE